MKNSKKDPRLLDARLGNREVHSRMTSFITFDLIIEILFLALMFLAPVIFDRRVGIVFSLSKITTIRMMTLVIIVLWAIKIIMRHEHKWARTILDWPVAIYLASCTIATITSVHIYTSFIGFYGRYEGLLTLWNYGLLFFIATNYIRSWDQIKRLLIVILSSATLMSIYGVIQRQELDPYAWGGVVTWQRVIGTIGQPNFLAAYIIMAFMLGLILFLGNQKTETREQSVKPDWLEQLTIAGYYLATQAIFLIMIYILNADTVFLWYLGFGLATASALLFAYSYDKLHPIIFNILIGVSLILTYICLLYTQSRGGYLGFFVSVVLFVLLVGRKIIIQNAVKIGGLAIIIISITSFTMINPTYSPFERFTSEVKISKTDEAKAEKVELGGAAGSRGETWKSAFNIIADHPFFGIGPEVLKFVFPRYETNLFRFKEGFHVKQDRCHNETFDTPVTKGLVTFFIYLWIFYILFSYALKRWRAGSAEEKLLIAGLIGASVAYIIQNQFSFGVVAITSLFWVIWAIIALDYGQQTSDHRPKEIKIEDVPWLPVTGVVLVVVFLCFMAKIPFDADRYFKTGKNFADMGNFTEAIKNYEQALKLTPYEGGFITHLGIVSLNEAQRQGNKKELFEKTISIFLRGTKVDPYNADNYYILGKTYLMLGDTNKAKSFSEIALKIDPYYAEAYLVLAMLAEREGRTQDASKLYGEAYRINPNLVEAGAKMNAGLMQSGQFEEAINKFQDILFKDPKNIIAHNGLGEIYYKQGKKQEAKAEFEQALMVDPNNEYAKKMLGIVK